MNKHLLLSHCLHLLEHLSLLFFTWNRSKISAALVLEAPSSSIVSNFTFYAPLRHSQIELACPDIMAQPLWLQSKRSEGFQFNVRFLYHQIIICYIWYGIRNGDLWWCDPRVRFCSVWDGTEMIDMSSEVVNVPGCTIFWSAMWFSFMSILNIPLRGRKHYRYQCYLTTQTSYSFPVEGTFIQWGPEVWKSPGKNENH